MSQDRKHCSNNHTGVIGSADAIAEAYQLLTEDDTVYVFDRRSELPPSCTVYDMAPDFKERMLQFLVPGSSNKEE